MCSDIPTKQGYSPKKKYPTVDGYPFKNKEIFKKEIIQLWKDIPQKQGYSPKKSILLWMDILLCEGYPSKSKKGSFLLWKISVQKQVYVSRRKYPTLVRISLLYRVYSPINKV